MQHKPTTRKPDLLLVLTLLTGLGVLASTNVDAEDTLFTDVNLFTTAALDDLADGEVQVAGNHLSGLHLSVESQSQTARYVSPYGGATTNDTGVHFSWKISW